MTHEIGARHVITFRRLASHWLMLTVVLLFALWRQPIAAQADDPSFFDYRNFGTGLDDTRSIALGDVNGDGALDIITGNEGQQNVVYLNDGSGNFDWLGSAVNYGTGDDNTTSVAVGDIDGDGDLDIVTGNKNQPNTIYLNAGTGNFGSASSFGTGVDRTYSVAVGDMDGDGHLDIVTGNEAQPNIVYLNNGMGGFHTGAVDCGNPPDNTFCLDRWTDSTTSVALGAINGDKHLDIAIGNTGIDGGRNAVYLNNGTGGFGSAVDLGTTDDRTTSMAIGDVDGDGYLDIIVVNEFDSKTGFKPNAVYINDGAGNFGSPLRFGADADTYSVAMGEVNGDGHFDIIIGKAGENTVYLNNGTGGFDQTRSFGTGSDTTYSVAVGDMDGDGDLDIVTGNYNEQNAVYLNDGSGSFDSAQGFGSLTDSTTSVAVGDVDDDGDLDLAVGNKGQPNRVFLNGGTGSFDNEFVLGSASAFTSSVAMGDMDGDHCLDIVTASEGGGNLVYLNDGMGGFDSTRAFGSGGDHTTSVATGDMDGDGDLDIVTGNRNEQNVVYLNDGAGSFITDTVDCGVPSENARCFGYPVDSTTSVAIGDMDGDGHLDIVAGSEGQNAVYLNDGTGRFDSVRDFGSGEDNTASVAVGDVDGDGDLDIVTGNHGQQNVVYLNDGAGHFGNSRNFGTGLDTTRSVTVGDVDGDGDLDLVVGNVGEQNLVFLNDGEGRFSIGSARGFGSGGDNTSSVAVGDVDRDGDLDIIAGNDGQNVVYINHVTGAARLVNNPPGVAVIRPNPAVNADFYSTATILDDRFIPMSYTLFDPDGDPVGRIAAFYSLDGGGRWYTATAASGTPTTNLATGLYATPTLTNTHVFTWDTFVSGVFGRSDNVVFRLEAYPQPVHAAITNTYRYTNTVPGPYQRPYASATTFPFRVWGTQVRVLNATVPVSSALVYRLPHGQFTGGALMTDGTGRPLRTDPMGYLQGRATIAISDTLVAMLPIQSNAAQAITYTDSFTLYYTSATPTAIDLEAYTVTQAGVQTLTVSSDHSFILFDLDLSLEWDARSDEQFMSQLQFDLQRASEILYDWTNGQAALGQVNVYHDREKWLDAHIRVYATNRMRPSATQGGIISETITDPLASAVTYAPGQVHMGAVWNRFGEPDGNLSEDWPRALAHELGHFAFFLDDNYLGLDPEGLLIPVETCPGAMSDPYREDDASGYDEFHHGDGWDEDCGDTLADRSTGRWDWQTITTFYPGLDGINTNTGPAGLPLAVTQIDVMEPVTPTTTLEVPIFYLIQGGGRVQPSINARAFLFQGDRLTDLGRPTLDQVHARGARPGDRVCVYELAAGRLGCKMVTLGDDQMTLSSVSEWQPEVIVSPITSQTVSITVTNLPTGLSLNARLFLTNDPVSPEIALVSTTDSYVGTFNLDHPTFEGYIHIWVNETEPRREIVTDYALGGNPGRMRLRRGRMRLRRAPAISSDGQVILFGEDLNFPEGEFYALQAATIMPQPLPWATMVGQAFQLSSSANAPDLSGTSISFNYLGSEVPPGEETWLRVYHWDGTAWQKLPTQLDTYHNLASAPTQGEGLYALMSSIEIPLHGPGWNPFAYPVPGTRPVQEALSSIDGFFSTVYGYVVTDTIDPWKIYDVDVPGWVNDLEWLRFGQGYWISITEPITVQLKGNATTGLATVNSLPMPPATYYGAVLPSPDLTPAAGMKVTAWVDGNLCGQTQTQEINKEIVFSIDVLADDLSDAIGCGRLGRSVTFHVTSELMAPSVPWDNNRVQERALHRIRLYLPLLLKNP